MVKIWLPPAQVQIAVVSAAEMGWNSQSRIEPRYGRGRGVGRIRTNPAALKTERTRDPQDCWRFRLALAQTNPAGSGVL